MKLITRGGLVAAAMGLVALGGVYTSSAAQHGPEAIEMTAETTAGPETTVAAPTSSPPASAVPRTTEEDERPTTVPEPTVPETTAAPEETTIPAVETSAETTAPETTAPETTLPEAAAPIDDTTIVPGTAASPVEETTPATTASETIPDATGSAAEAADPPVVIDTRCWVNDGLYVWRLTDPNSFDVAGTFLVDGSPIATPTVPAGGVTYVGFAAPRQPGYLATFVPTAANVTPSAATTSSGVRCAYHLDINLSWRGGDVPSDADLVDFRLIVRSQVEELVFGWAGGGLFLISETALTGDQIYQARAGWLDVPTGGRWQSDVTGLPPGWAQRDSKSDQVFAPSLGEVPSWAGPFFGGDDTQQLVLVVRFEPAEENLPLTPAAPAAPAPAAPATGPAPAAPAAPSPAVDQRNLPITGAGGAAALVTAALTLLAAGTVLRRSRRRSDEILISRPV